ncbi:hypothetical protein HMPREF7545_1124 [Selenomonas noxia ATCC 43541]|nr:hypothetical protein HMPREF7545_1124 [Selenomonas noxia ATCC 43541]
MDNILTIYSAFVNCGAGENDARRIARYCAFQCDLQRHGGL